MKTLPFPCNLDFFCVYLNIDLFYYYYRYLYIYSCSHYQNDVVTNIKKFYVVFLCLPMKKNKKLQIKKGFTII